MSTSSSPDRIIAEFLAQIANVDHPQYGRQYLTELLEPALKLEASIRESFLTGQRPGHAAEELYLGLFDVFGIPSSVRRVQAREENTPLTGNRSSVWGALDDMVGDTNRFSFFSCSPGFFASFSKHNMFPIEGKLFRKTGVPCMVENLAAFRENLRIFTHGALDAITDWSNMVITGGAVVASLCGRTPSNHHAWTPADINSFFQQKGYYLESDVDVFLYGLTPEQAVSKTRQIYQAISKSALWKLTIVRKVDRISIHTLYPCRPVHIHLMLYSSPAELSANCDIDCSSCIYNGSTVYMTPRALVAFIRQTNTIDLSRWSPSYELRLACYGRRGFEVDIPFLERDRVAYQGIYDRNLTELPGGMVRLLLLELMHQLPGFFYYLDDDDSAIRAQPDGLASASLYAPIDKRLQGYPDMSWVRVPYGARWDDLALRTMIETIDKEVNSATRVLERGGLHRHPVYASNELSDCLKSNCERCPAPSSKVPVKDSHSASEEDTDVPFTSKLAHLSGPLRQVLSNLPDFQDYDIVCRFYPMGIHKKDASRLLGDSQSKRHAAWIADAYLQGPLKAGDMVIDLLTRRCWGECVFNDIETYGRSIFVNVEGAKATALTSRDISAKVDRLMEIWGEDSDSMEVCSELGDESEDGEQ